MPLKNWLRSLQRTLTLPSATRRRTRKARIEELERRIVPATKTWDGGGADNLWSTAANWDLDVAPAAGDDIVFAGTTRPSPDLDAAAALLVYQSVRFANGGFTLNSTGFETLQISGGGGTNGIQNSAETNTIALDVELSGDIDIDIDGGILILAPTGDIDSDATARSVTVTIAPGATLDIQGQFGVNSALDDFTVATTTGTLLFNSAFGSDPVTDEAMITTDGDQSYSSAVTVANDSLLVSAGDITFASTAPVNSLFDPDPDVETKRNLSIDVGGTLLIDVEFGGTVPLNQFLTTGAGTTVFSGEDVTTQANIRAGAIDSPGHQTYENAVEIGATVTLRVNPLEDVHDEGDIIFGDTIGRDGLTGSLTVSTSGRTEFNGDVGVAGTPLTSLVVNFGVTPVFPILNFFRRSDEQTFIDATAMFVTTLTLNEPTEVGSDLTITGTTVSFNAGLWSDSGFNALVVNASGTTRFGNGSATIIEEENQEFFFGVDLVTDLVGRDAWDTTQEFSLFPFESITTDAPGTTIFDVIGRDFSPSNYLQSVLTRLGQTYNDSVSLEDDTILHSTAAGDISLFGSVTGSFALQVNTEGDTFFGNSVGDLINVGSLETDNSNAGFDPDLATNLTTFRIGAGGIDVVAEGSQIYNDRVRLATDIDFASDGFVNGNIEFNQALDTDLASGFASATFTTSNDTIFRDHVGNLRPLNEIRTDPAGRTLFVKTAAERLLDGDPVQRVKSIGQQWYQDRVFLGGDTFFDNTGPRDIAFTAGVNSFDATGQGSLRIVSVAGSPTLGDGVGDDRIGGLFPLFQVEIGGSPAIINIANASVANPSILTNDNQTYNSHLRLVLDTYLNTRNVPANGAVQFFGEVRNFYADGAVKLSANAGSIVNFANHVGTTGSPLGSVFTNEFGYTGGPGQTQFNVGGSSELVPSIRTSGVQRYNNPVVLGVQTVLLSTAGGNIALTSTVDSRAGFAPQELAIFTAGNTDFGDGGRDYIGSLNPLQTILTDSPGAVRFNIAGSGNEGQLLPESVRTVGNQRYRDRVILQNYTTMASDGAIEFDTAIQGSFLLTIDVGLSGPWFDTSANNAAVKVIQDGVNITFIDRLGVIQRGVLTGGNNGLINGTQPFTIDGDTITFAGPNGGVRWIRYNLSGHFKVGSALATIQQTGASLNLVRPDGLAAEGQWTTHSQIFVDGFGPLFGNLFNGAITFSNGAVWLPLRFSPEWTVNGRRARLLQDGLNITLIDENGNASAAALLNPTTITAFGRTGTIANGQIRFSNGVVWRKNLTISGVDQLNRAVHITAIDQSVRLIDERGRSTNARLVSRNIITGPGFGTGTVNNGRIVFTNGSIWTFRQSDLDRLYGDITSFPFG